MKKTRRRALYILAALLAALFVLSCLVGFAACGGGDDDDDDVPGSSQDDDTKGDTGDTGSGDQGGSGDSGSGSGNSGSGSGSGDTGSGSGDTGSGGGSTGTYEYRLTLEAENAGLFDPVGKEDGSMSGILKTEAIDSSDPDSGTCVANFKTAGDMIVFDVYADAATTVDVSITANYSKVQLSSATDFDASAHSIFYVNGMETDNLVTLSGTLDKDHSYGTLTASDVSLVKGVNYLILTCTSVEANSMGFMNVDKMEIGWNGTASITETTVGEGDGAKMSVATEVTNIDAVSDYAASIEAENAGLFDPVGKEDGSMSGILKTEAIDSSDPESGTCVANFKTAGDMIVFDVYADAATTVDVSITANYSKVQITSSSDFVASDHSIFYVNGMETDNLVTLSGTLDKDHSYGTLTASDVSLVKGVNYLILTCTSVEESTMGFMNVDRIDLNGGTYKEPATEVSDEIGLVEALEEGGDIVLTTDITVGTTASEADTAALTVSEDTEIDLAGKSITTGTLSSALNTIEVEEGATLTITDSTGEGAIENTYATHVSNDNAAAIEVNGGSLIIESGMIESTSVGIRALGGSVTINGGTVYSSGYYALWESEGQVDVVINDGIVGGSYAGILVDGDSNFGYSDLQENAKTTLTVNGGIVYSGGEGQAAIRTESMTSKDSAIITINGGLVYGAEAAPGIFLGNGTLKITDGIIAGSTAAEVQAGDVTIGGGVFYATDDEQKITYTTSNSASFTNGYALSIIPRGNVWRVASDDSFSMALTVTVTGGTFYGDVYVAATSVLADTDGSTWTLNGTDGNYVVSISNVGGDVIISGKLVMTNTETGKNVVADSDETWGNYDRVIGERGNSDSLYWMGGVAFDGSKATATRSEDGYTYVISGTSASMTEEQLKAYWVLGDGDTHDATDYIAIAIIAGAGETVTTTTSDGTLVSTTDGGTAGKAQPIVINVTDYDAETSDFYLNVVVTDTETGALKAAYIITLGTITTAAAAEPQG